MLNRVIAICVSLFVVGVGAYIYAGTGPKPYPGQRLNRTGSGFVCDSDCDTGFECNVDDVCTIDVNQTADIQFEANEMSLLDATVLCHGTDCDYWEVYNTSGTQWELWTSDDDGGGSDGLLMSVDDGTDDVDFSAGVTVAETLTVTGEINGAILKTDEVAISLAEMTGLVAANKTLVAAKGANTIIVPVSVLFFLDYGSAQFTESADNLELHYVDAAGDVICTAFETTGSWLVAAADGYGYYTCDSNILATTAQAVNTAVTLDNNGDGDFGGGTGSTVTAWITYYVIDVS
jgi:hypothetical protein